jgi:hypothetical protein
MALLFTTVFYCIYWGIGGWYMYVMAGLAAGLSFSSNMALAEVMSIQRAEGRQEEIDGLVSLADVGAIVGGSRAAKSSALTESQNTDEGDISAMPDTADDTQSAGASAAKAKRKHRGDD